MYVLLMLSNLMHVLQLLDTLHRIMKDEDKVVRI